MEKIVLKPSDPKILGAGILSCISGIQLLGENGKALSKKLSLNKIKPEKKYSYKLRSLIVEEVLKRYGEVGIYALGLSMTDGFQSPVMSELAKAKRRIERDIQSKKITEEKGLEIFLNVYARFINSTLKNVFNWNQKNQGIILEKVDVFKYKLHITVLALYRHWEWVKAAQCELVMRHISNLWVSDWELIENESKQLTHGSYYVAYVTFTKNKYPLDSFAIAERHKHQITKDFLQLVLKASDDKKTQIEIISRQIGKYIPPQIHNALFSGKYDTTITTRRKKITIFFSDIKNFTSTSEGLQPEDLTKYLNRYFSEMTAIAINYGATIDKYIGDAMMVFFGDPESRGERKDARACVEMALKMQDRMKELQDEWSNDGFSDPFQVRMGINTGYCNVGNFGSDQRLTYTIIGGEVNIAQRLEASAEANGILMSYETYAHAQDMIKVKEHEAIKMKGINREIKVFSIIERQNSLKIKKSHMKNKVTKKELSEIEKIKKDLAVIQTDMNGLKKNIEIILKKL